MQSSVKSTGLLPELNKIQIEKTWWPMTALKIKLGDITQALTARFDIVEGAFFWTPKPVISCSAPKALTKATCRKAWIATRVIA